MPKGRKKKSTRSTKEFQPREYVTRKYVIHEIAKSKCPICNSTRRTRYYHRTLMELSADDPRGTHIVWRSCQCLDCGTFRKDQTAERIEKKPNSA